MASTTGLVRIHANLSYTFLGFALVLNALVFVLVRKAEKMDSFRCVFYAYCVADTIFAIVHAISLMYWAHLPNILLFFPTGPLAHWPVLTPIAFQLQSTAYVFVMCLVCSTFLHRYKLVNRSLYLFQSDFRNRLIHVVVYLPVIQWFINCAILMRPNDQLRAKANGFLGAEYGVNFETIYLVGVDISVIAEVDPLLIVSALSLFFVLITLMSVILWCGLGIHRFIYKSSMTSERSKQMQRYVLKILVFQAVHPLLLLHAPSIVNFAQLLLDIQLPEEANLLLALCIAVFPVTNPILTLFLSKDLRAHFRSFLSNIGIGSTPSASVIAVTVKPSVVKRPSIAFQ